MLRLYPLDMMIKVSDAQEDEIKFDSTEVKTILLQKDNKCKYAFISNF